MIETALGDIAAGRIVILVDADDTRGGSWMCLALTVERCEELALDIVAAHHEPTLRTPMMVSVDAREVLTNGTTATDLARTIQVAIDPATTTSDLVVPGQVTSVKPRSAGVLERTGHAEVGVDLAREAGCNPRRGGDPHRPRPTVDPDSHRPPTPDPRARWPRSSRRRTDPNARVAAVIGHVAESGDQCSHPDNWELAQVAPNACAH
jgi:hypothetical protein